MLENLKHIAIEPTNMCNLSCKFCSDTKTRAKGYMDTPLFKKIINQCPEDVEIRLFLSGEPLMHPDIIKLINIAGEKCKDVLIHTNGTKLNTTLIDKLINSKLTKISFSIDGSSSEEYENARGASFDIVKKNVQYFLENNNSKIHTTIQSIIPYSSNPNDALTFIDTHFEGYSKAYIRNPHSWNKEGLIKGASKQDYEIPCFFLKNYMAIYWNGEVPLCCADLNGDYGIGNVNEQPLKYIWYQIQKHKRKQENKEEFYPCSKCERYNI